MSTINFQGAIMEQLTELFLVDDGFSAGEKLTHLEKQLERKKFFYASDQEIYEKLSEILKTKNYYQDDEPNAN